MSSRKVVDTSDDEDPPPPSRKRTRTSRATRGSAVQLDSPSATPRSRAAKVKANKKLDAQAKELAEFQRQAAASVKTRTTRQKPQASTPQKQVISGTRASARLRGSTRGEDEWQEIPEEWLKASASSDDDTYEEDQNKSIKRVTKVGRGKGRDDDAASDISSELTELSDTPDAPEDGEQVIPDHDNTQSDPPSPKNEDVQRETVDEPAVQFPSDFVEWELVSRNSSICVLIVSTVS